VPASNLWLIWPQLLGTEFSALSQPEIIGIRAQLFVTGFGDKKIVFQAQPTSARPVNTRLDSQHHVLSHGATSGLMCVGKFVRPRAYTVTYCVRGLARISAFGNSSPDQTI
jgi:hypothetical protein